MTRVRNLCRKARRPRHGSVGGFTLLEVILTFGLLVVLAAVFWPNIGAMKDASRLDRAVDDVRGLLVGLRVRAMNDATRYQFACEDGASSFQITRLGDASVEAGAPAAAPARVTFDAENLVGTHELEKGLTFAVLSDDPQGGRFDGGPVSLAISFSPDGTTSDATFDIVDDAGIGRTIEVRGLTGAVTVRPRSQ